MKTPEKGASLAANMLQMGSIYGQVSSPSPQQMQPPFYDSNPSVQGATGWVKTIKIFRKLIIAAFESKFSNCSKVPPGGQKEF